MKSYIQTEQVTLYTCDICGHTWTTKQTGWEDPATLPDDGTPPVYEERDVPRAGGGVIKAMIEISPPTGNYGVQECPACGGSRPAVMATEG